LKGRYLPVPSGASLSRGSGARPGLRQARPTDPTHRTARSTRPRPKGTRPTRPSPGDAARMHQRPAADAHPSSWSDMHGWPLGHETGRCRPIPTSVRASPSVADHRIAAHRAGFLDQESRGTSLSLITARSDQIPVWWLCGRFRGRLSRGWHRLQARRGNAGPSDAFELHLRSRCFSALSAANRVTGQPKRSVNRSDRSDSATELSAATEATGANGATGATEATRATEATLRQPVRPGLCRGRSGL
jgi:hypothetical protein